jgi:hypothetical protein
MANCTCGCCAGTSVQTPQLETNLSGLRSISYRVGTWATFKESMLARLSSSDYPALAGLKTRDDDDFTIAYLDACAVVLDILTFYQERLANESYSRTAVQLQSLIELSRLIGYQPSPGVSASVYLAFSLITAPGQPPDQSAPAITIPAGTQVQSVPAQGQTPQTFETSADIQAKPDWNALPVLTGQPWVPQIGDRGVYLQGTATQLQPGDLILVVGNERLNSPSSENWDVRVVVSVQPDTQNDRTFVTWDGGLGDAAHDVEPAQQQPQFYALRQRASLFGYNAVNPQMLAADTITRLQSDGLLSGSDWAFAAPASSGSFIDLDAVYPKIVRGGWIVLITPDGSTNRSPAGLVSLYGVTSITTIARSDYALSAKISRAAVDSSTNLSTYYGATRTASAVAQSDNLPVALQPLDYPLYGTVVDLQDLRYDLVGAQVVALLGTRQKLSVAAGTTVTFYPADGTAPLTLNPGDAVTVLDPKPLPTTGPGQAGDWKSASARVLLTVADASGRPGTVQATMSSFSLAPPASTDPSVSEFALVSAVSLSTTPYPHTQILLQAALANCYNRVSATVNANVSAATAGQSVSEILGSGNAPTPNQSFTLKQAPLTFVQAPTPSGGQSTLQVQVSGVDWTPVPTLYNQGPSEQVFAALNQAGGVSEVLFGDGVEGATIPSGTNNVTAKYRIGLGAAGNVAAGSISTLIDRPLGVSGVTNPQPATGGADADTVDNVRASAPLSVLTLGRAVSITDYQNYAAAFAGIAKAYAIWIPSGPARGVFLTVAGVRGADLAGSSTLTRLVTSLQNYGNPLIPIIAVSFLETLFSLTAYLKYDPAYDAPTVRNDVLEALYGAYSFEARTFGQGVSVDEVATLIQGVPGVMAVNVTNLAVVATSAGGDLAGTPGGFTLSNYSNWLSRQVPSLPRPASGSPTRICPYLPVASRHGLPAPAEISVLDPDPSQVVLGVMP